MKILSIAVLLMSSIAYGQTTSGLPSPVATSSTPGSIQPDGTTVTISSSGILSSVSSTPSTPQYVAPQAIAGCGVEYVSGLTYTVGACNYSINGITYNSVLSNITLATADPTNPRIDVIYVDTTQVVQKITGTPGATPQQPVVDPSTQLQLTFVLVPATATTPSNTTVTTIYAEGTEWTGSVGGTNSARVNLTSTNNPYLGTHDTEFGNGGTVTTTTFAQYTKPSAGTENLSNYNALVFYVRNKAAWPNSRSVTVQWYNGATPTGIAVVLSNGAFGFNARTNTTGYQQVSIPASTFGIPGVSVTSVRFTVSGTGSALTGFYLDQVTLQGGNGGVVLPSTLMNFKGAWSASTTYNPNDLVVVTNAGYVALLQNTNQTVGNVTYWSSLVPAGTVGGCTFNVFGTENYNICGAMPITTGGHDNTSSGFNSMASLTGGVRNTAYGDQTLSANTSGSFNTAIGQGALVGNVGGSSNTVIGTAADTVNISGNNITAVGMAALSVNLSGDNTGLGQSALGSNTTGGNNVAIGEALEANQTGNENTAGGNGALFASLASGNTAFGFESATTTTSGSDNAAYGWKSFRDNSTGSNNTAMGALALLQTTTPSNNTALGFEAGYNPGIALTTISNSLFLGANAVSTTDGLTNMIVIGYNAQGTASNQVTLGNTSVTSTVMNGTIHSVATAPSPSSGTLTGTNAGGLISGLSVATSVTITFANSGWTTWASCTATPSVTGITVYNSSQSTTAVTFSFAALTGTLYYACVGN